MALTELLVTLPAVFKYPNIKQHAACPVKFVPIEKYYPIEFKNNAPISISERNRLLERWNHIQSLADRFEHDYRSLRDHIQSKRAEMGYANNEPVVTYVEHNNQIFEWENSILKVEFGYSATIGHFGQPISVGTFFLEVPIYSHQLFRETGDELALEMDVWSNLVDAVKLRLLRHMMWPPNSPLQYEYVYRDNITLA